MTRKKLNTLFTVSIAVGLMALFASTSQASFILTIDDTATTGIDIVIVDDFDGGVGTLVNADVDGNGSIDVGGEASNTADGIGGGVDGAIGFLTFAINSTWTVTISGGTSKFSIGGPTSSVMDLVYSITSTGSGGTLIITLTDDGFAIPLAPVNPILMSTEFGNTAGGSITGTTTLDNGNNEFAIGPGAKFTDVTPSLGPGAFADESSQFISPYVTPFSLTLKVAVTHASSGSTSVGSSGNYKVFVEQTPEPATFTIWACLSGIGFVGAGWRKRRKKNVA